MLYPLLLLRGQHAGKTGIVHRHAFIIEGSGPTYPAGEVRARERSPTTRSRLRPRPMRTATRSDARWFYVGVVAFVILFTLISFGPSLIDPSNRSVPLPLTPWVLTHTALSTAWLLLFLAQTTLVATGRTRIHRRLGIAGAVIAAALVITGPLMMIEEARRGFDLSGDLVPRGTIQTSRGIAHRGQRLRSLRPPDRRRIVVPATSRRSQATDDARHPRSADRRAARTFRRPLAGPRLCFPGGDDRVPRDPAGPRSSCRGPSASRVAVGWPFRICLVQLVLRRDRTDRGLESICGMVAKMMATPSAGM